MALSDPVAILRDREQLRRLFGTVVVPVVAALAVFGLLDKGGLSLSEKAVGAAVGAVLLAAAVRWPGAAIGVVVVFVPLQTTVLAYAYKHGAPAGPIRQLSFLKDLATLGVVIAAVLQSRKMPAALRKRLDALDWFALAYLGIATAYLVIPEVAKGSLGGQSLNVRESAWRLDCLFVVLMFAARRYDFSAATLRRLRSSVFVVGAIMLGFAIYESVNKTGYNHFLVNTIDLPAYQVDILKATPPAFNNYVTAGFNAGVNTVRVGSLFADAIALGFYMVLPLAYGLERLTKAGPRPLILLGTVAGAVTIVLSETRSAILSGLVAAVALLWINQRRKVPGRLRMGVLMVAIAILLVPYAAHTTAGKRFSNIYSSNNTDSVNHASATIGGTTSVLTNPAGRGLGANPTTGARYDSGNYTDTENSYLQVGTELGVAGMIAFVGMFLALIVQLWRRSRMTTARGQLAAGSWLAACGLLIGGLFLQIWTGLAVALTLWGLAGAALYRYEELPESAHMPPVTPGRSAR